MYDFQWCDVWVGDGGEVGGGKLSPGLSLMLEFRHIPDEEESGAVPEGCETLFLKKKSKGLLTPPVQCPPWCEKVRPLQRGGGALENPRDWTRASPRLLAPSWTGGVFALTCQLVPFNTQVRLLAFSWGPINLKF